MGSKILYYFVILPISLLPFWAIYALSDFTYLILYKLIGYRTKVVRNNIRHSFPEKSDKEIKQIESAFYRHLCDVIVEAIKAFTISEEDAKKRMVHQNPDLLDQFYQEGKQVVLAGGHYGNWELFAITIGMNLEHKALALYTPLKNEFFNEKVKNSRAKYGLGMLSIQEIRKKLAELDDGLYAIIFGADQSPRKSQKAYWMKFLGQETGVQFGTEKFAKEIEAAVVFGNIHRIKRGFYEVRYQVISPDAQKEAYGYITQAHTKLLEREVLKKPEHWLWSHKRWKHPKPEDMPLNEDLKISL